MVLSVVIFSMVVMSMEVLGEWNAIAAILKSYPTAHKQMLAKVADTGTTV